MLVGENATGIVPSTASVRVSITRTRSCEPSTT
jgi:hypothetical protein